MFANVVRLYRLCGRPIWSAGAFSYEGPASTEIDAAIAACSEAELHRFGGFDGDVERRADGTIEFTFNTPANERGRFFASVDAFVLEAKAVSAGALPDAFYLVDSDYLSGEKDPPPRLAQALQLSRLAALLARVSSYASREPDGPFRLIFNLAGRGVEPPREIGVVTRITSGCLDAPRPCLGKLEALLAPGADAALHVHEHRQLFRLSVTEVLAAHSERDSQSRFEYLVRSWAEVLKRDAFNAEVYVAKFSFEKLKAEIARTELEFSGRLASVLGDSTGKLLALPLSAAAIAAMLKVASIYEALALLVSVIIGSALILAVVHNQLLSYRRVRAGFELAMSDLADAERQRPQALTTALDAAREGFDHQSRHLLAVTRGIRVLAWTVLLVVAAIAAYRFIPWGPLTAGAA